MMTLPLKTGLDNSQKHYHLQMAVRRNQSLPTDTLCLVHYLLLPHDLVFTISWHQQLSNDFIWSVWHPPVFININGGCCLPLAAIINGAIYWSAANDESRRKQG